MKRMLILETERLTVRQFTADDAAFALRLLNEPSFVENIGDKGVRNMEDARSYLRNGPMASYERYGFGLWRVATKENDVPIGMCGLIKRDVLEDVDIGYAFLPEFGSRGYGSEVVAAVRAYAKERLGLARVVAVVNRSNGRSIRLLEKQGFRYERMVRLAEDEDEILLLASVV